MSITQFRDVLHHGMAVTKPDNGVMSFPVDTPEVVLVTDEWPLWGQTGQQSYLRSIIEWLDARCLRTLVIVTGARTSDLYIQDRLIGASDNIRFVSLQDFRVAGGFVPGTLKSMARLLYRRIRGNAFLRFVLPTLDSLQRSLGRKKASGSSVLINRWLTGQEIGKVRKLFQRQNLRPKLVLIDTLFKSGALDAVAAEAKKILIAHDVFSERCDSFIRQGLQPWPLVSREEEARHLERFDCVLAISEPDGEAFRAMHGRPSVHVVPATSTCVPVKASGRRRSAAALLFIGSRSSHNTHGLKWFLSEVWPTVLQKLPQARLNVIGTVCDEIAEEHPNVVLHGRLDDPSVVAYECSAAINPVLAGSGMKVKVLDYAALSLPTVSTLVGAAGLEHFSRTGGLVIADDPATFATHVSHLLRQDEESAARGNAAAISLNKHFSSGVLVKRLDKAIKPLLVSEAEETGCL